MNCNVMVLGALLVLTLGSALASESLNGKTKADNKNASVLNEVNNKICPVSGQPVGTMGDIVKYEYNGKIYNLCCPACKKDFLKDSEKYSKIAENEVKN